MGRGPHRDRRDRVDTLCDVSATPEQQAADPTTPPQTLADLAATYPQLQPVIALNPATYDGLLDWLRQYGGADVQAALAARAAGATPPPPFATTPPPPPPASTADVAVAPAYAATPHTVPAYAVPTYGVPATRFVEPSRSIPITYLNHDLRYVLALLGVGVAGLLQVVLVPLLLDGLASLVYASADWRTAETQFAIVSTLLRVMPWLFLGGSVFLLPARPKNKMLALALVAGPIALILLGAVFTVAGINIGVDAWPTVAVLNYIGLLFPAAAVGAWLAARMRPGVAFALLPITLLTTSVNFLTGSPLVGGYSYGLHPASVVFGVLSIGILVGIAWLARLIAARRATAPTPEERGAALEAQQHAARVAHVQQWEAAYAAAHGGMAPPPGTVVPPMTTYAAPGADSGRTNMMAILALVFGIGGGLLGIVFGHIALAQIRRTGEQGRGLALAGLICGYIGAVILLGVIIFYIGIFASLGRYY